MSRFNRFLSFEGTAGTVLGSGIKPAGDFPLIDAHDVQVDEAGGNLADFIDSLGEGGQGCSHDWSPIDKLSALLPAEQCISKTVDYCSKCSLMRMNLVDDHGWVAVNTVAPTCTTKGNITYTCKTCNANKTEWQPALGHSLITVEAQAPTLTSIGWNEYKKCTRSGCTYTEGYEELPATGYAVTYDLTGCTLDAGSSVIGDDGMVVTFAANYGYTFGELAVTRVRGCSYSITLQTDDTITLSLTKPTGDVTIKIMATNTYGSTGGAVTIPFTVAPAYANYYSISSQTPATVTAPDGCTIDDITIGSMSCDHSSLSITGVTAVVTIADDGKSATISLSGNTQGTTGGSNSATMTVNYTMKYSKAST